MSIKRVKIGVCLASMAMFLNGCALFPDNDDNHHRICSQLKYQMMFSNGAGAMDQNDAFTQRADQARASQMYHDKCT